MNLSIGPAIDIIIGPMFSGKTSELLRRLSIYHDMEKKVLYVNSAQDSRSGEDFSTHNPCIGKIPFHSQKTNNLESVDFESYDVIGIDEASLFSALKSFVLKWVAAGKTIIVAGLNADSNGNKLGEIVDLIPVCDQLCKLFGFCLPCNKRGINSASVMTKRIVNNTNQILIGGKDSYIPVCRKCHMEIDALCEGYKLHQLNQGDNQINNQINNKTDNQINNKTDNQTDKTDNQINNQINNKTDKTDNKTDKTDNKTDKTDKTDIKKSASDLESFIRAYETFHIDKNLGFNTKHNFVLDSSEEKNKPEEISVVKLIKQQIFCDPCSTISHSFNDDIALKVTKTMDKEFPDIKDSHLAYIIHEFLYLFTISEVELSLSKSSKVAYYSNICDAYYAEKGIEKKNIDHIFGSSYYICAFAQNEIVKEFIALGCDKSSDEVDKILKKSTDILTHAKEKFMRIINDVSALPT